MSNLLQEIEQALDSPVPPGEATTAIEAIAAESVPEEAAAAGVAITATEFFPVVVILGLLSAIFILLRPLLKAQAHGHQSLLGRFVNWVGTKLETGIRYIEARVAHAMSHWLAPKTGRIAHWLNSTAHVLHVLTQDVGDLADNVHEALVFLRHHIVPHLIVTALRPVVRAVDSLNSELTRAHRAIANQLALIGHAVAAGFVNAVNELAHVVAELYLYVHNTVKPQLAALTQRVTVLANEVKTLTVTVVQRIEPQVQALTQRVTKLEAQLAPAALAALVVAALGTAWQNLTCRNTQTAASQLCAMDENLLNDALALLAGAFALLSLEEYVRIMQSITRDTTEVVHSLLSV